MRWSVARMAPFVHINNNYGVPLKGSDEKRLQELAWGVAEVFGERPFRVIIMPDFSRPGAAYSVIVKFDRKEAQHD